MRAVGETGSRKAFVTKLHRAERGILEDSVPVVQECLDLDCALLDESAVKLAILDQAFEGSLPLFLVFPQQCSLTLFQLCPPRLFVWTFGKFALHSNKLGPRVTSFFQPVGEDQARSVIVWGGEDSLEKGVVRHWHFV